MIEFIICIFAALTAPYCQIESGYASQYESEIIMDETVAARQEWGVEHRYGLPKDTTFWNGFVATNSCDLIGDTAYISVQGKEWEPYLVSDCAGNDGTPEWMERNSILVEFDARTAKKLSFYGTGGVHVDVVFLPQQIIEEVYTQYDNRREKSIKTDVRASEGFKHSLICSDKK